MLSTALKVDPVPQKRFTERNTVDLFGTGELGNPHTMTVG